MTTQVHKNRMISMPREKVPESTALVGCATYSRLRTPVTPSPHEVTHVIS